MDFLAVGFPSALTTRGFQLLEAAIRDVLPELSVLHLDRFDTVDDLGRSPKPRLLLSTFPSPELAKDCQLRAIPSIVFADDVLDAVRHVRAQFAISTVEALRPITAGLVLSGPFARSSRNMIVRPDHAASGTALQAMMLRHLGLRRETGQGGLTAGGVGDQAAGDRQIAMNPVMPNAVPIMLDEVELSLCEQVLGGLVAYVNDGEPGIITWPRGSFLAGDHPNQAAPVALEVTGRARIIYYGPYFHLPAGSWTVRVNIGFSQDIRGLPFSIDVHSRTSLGSARIFASRGGIFSAEFKIVVDLPHEPIEIRIMNEQGAIEGHMGLVGVDFFDWRPTEGPTITRQADGLPRSNKEDASLG